jgi:two-component system response regulator MtrA
MKPRVLVVDDDAALAEMLGIVLRAEGFEPAFVADGSKAQRAFDEFKPDIVLLDLMLPGMNGLEVCRSIRTGSGTPIVMLTAKTDTVDVVLGLESGADDYITKPFKPKELVARVRARLRQHEDVPAETLTIGPGDDLVTIDVLAHQVVRGGESIADTRLVNVHVQRLRSKIERDPENPDVVMTVRGVGYKAGT